MSLLRDPRPSADPGRTPEPAPRHWLLLGLEQPLGWEIWGQARRDGQRLTAVWQAPKPPTPIGDHPLPEILSGDPDRPDTWSGRLPKVDAILDLRGAVLVRNRRFPGAAGRAWFKRTAALLETAKRAGVPRVVLLGDARWFADREAGEGKFAATPRSYGFGRAVAPYWERVRTLCRNSGCVLRVHPGWIYGRDDWFSTEVINALKYQGQAWVTGTGRNWIMPLHSRDAAHAVLLAAEHGTCDQDYWLTAENLPWEEFLNMTARYMGIQNKLRRVPAWWLALRWGRMAVEHLQISCRGRSDRAARELGWILRYPALRDGLPAALKELGVLAWK